VELTVTNSPFGLTIKFYCKYRVEASSSSSRKLQDIGAHSVSVVRGHKNCGITRQYSISKSLSSAVSRLFEEVVRTDASRGADEINTIFG
jgi:hypothetical protein